MFKRLILHFLCYVIIDLLCSMYTNLYGFSFDMCNIVMLQIGRKNILQITYLINLFNDTEIKQPCSGLTNWDLTQHKPKRFISFMVVTSISSSSLRSNQLLTPFSVVWGVVSVFLSHICRDTIFTYLNSVHHFMLFYCCYYFSYVF